MKTLFIPLTLMRNSQKIKVNVHKILNYKGIPLGSGSIMSLSEKIEGSETVMVDESVDEIDELIFIVYNSGGIIGFQKKVYLSSFKHPS